MAEVIAPGTVRASSWIVDHLVAGSPAPIHIAGLSHPLDDVLAAELAGTQADLPAAGEEILLAALGGAVARTVGDGLLDMDVDIDAGGQPTVGHAALRCQASPGQYGRRLLTAGREALSGVQPAPARTYRSDVRFSYRTAVPGPAPDTGHLLALHACHRPGVVDLDWWYDARSFDRGTVEEIAAQFPLALIAICAGQ